MISVGGYFIPKAIVYFSVRQYILERFYSALCYHSRDQIWRDIVSLDCLAPMNVTHCHQKDLPINEACSHT